MPFLDFLKFGKKQAVINEIDEGMMRNYIDLDEHRVNLWVTLTKALNPKMVWKSTCDCDGNIKPGWFILGYRTKPGKQIMYYVPIEYWAATYYAVIRKRAPKHDGHSAKDITNRIKNLIIV